MRILPATRFALAALITIQVQAADAELIAHYKFDETAGSSATDSATANDASWVPGSQATPDWQPAGGVIGGAIRFPGSGTHQNYFSVASFPELNGTPAGMTIAAWFKPNSNSGYRGIVMSRDVNTGPFGFGHDSDHLDGRVDGASIDSPDDTLLASGEWFHIAWAWDNNTRTQLLYINGVRTGDPVPVAAQAIAANSDWRIGDDECCSNRNLDGLLDDLAIYDEALAPAQVAALYTNGIDGYSADESPGPPVTDPLNVGLVINEIYHDAEPKTAKIEFVELLNTGPLPLDLGGYRFTSGVDYTFPAGAMLGVTEYLVLGEEQFDGALSNDGDTLELIDAAGNLVDRVDYRAEFPWPITSGGESIQLVNATLDNDLGGTWRPALPTPGIQNRVFMENAPPQLRHC